MSTLTFIDASDHERFVSVSSVIAWLEENAAECKAFEATGHKVSTEKALRGLAHNLARAAADARHIASPRRRRWLF